MVSRLTPRVNIWLEADGDVAISLWRAELLDAVDRTGSISAAAVDMGIQYRLAWQRIHEMEERLGVALIVPTIGGKGGGGAKLTPTARDLLKRFLLMAQVIDTYAHEQCRIHLDSFLDEESS